MKRDYIGGEPTYKQVERLQKIQENEIEKWRTQEMTIAQAVPVVQPTYIDQPKEFIANQALYFSDVTGMLQQQPGQMGMLFGYISLSVRFRYSALPKQKCGHCFSHFTHGYG